VDYHIIFVKEGKCIAIYEGKKYILNKGNIMIYPPDVRHEYYFEESCTTIWTHFAGRNAAELLEESGLKSGFGGIEFDARILNTFLQLGYYTNQAEKRKYSSAWLHMLVAYIAESLRDKTFLPQTITDALSYISINYDKELSLEKLAASACLSKSRFSHLFSELTGTTPKKYQQKLRLTCAAELLSTTLMTVGEIAEKVGYSDGLYFSRIFKSKYGVSPMGYRYSVK
jgi:AraC-like DNA-binding protein